MSDYAAFTPGPWRVLRPSVTDRTWHVTDVGDTFVADVYGFNRAVNEQAQVNARLIAAAPELLEALEEAVSLYGKPGGPWNVLEGPGAWITKARAAIAKARGAAA